MLEITNFTKHLYNMYSSEMDTVSIIRTVHRHIAILYKTHGRILFIIVNPLTYIFDCELNKL